MNQLVDLCSTTPARVMGMANKGDIAPGMDADLALIDPSHERVVDHQTLQSRADWSPYQGQRLRGWAKHTLVRGALVVREYEVVGRRGHGVFMKRALT
jgi:dihydroorotase-like cyclic amidohydrolase